MNEIYRNRKIKLLICIVKEIQNFCKKQTFRKCNTGTTILNTLKTSLAKRNYILKAAS